MMLIAWRIVQAQHITSAYDGEGARRYGGRWNHKGVPMVYAAESLSCSTRIARSFGIQSNFKHLCKHCY